MAWGRDLFPGAKEKMGVSEFGSGDLRTGSFNLPTICKKPLRCKRSWQPKVGRQPGLFPIDMVTHDDRTIHAQSKRIHRTGRFKVVIRDALEGNGRIHPARLRVEKAGLPVEPDPIQAEDFALKCHVQPDPF